MEEVYGLGQGRLHNKHQAFASKRKQNELMLLGSTFSVVKRHRGVGDHAHLTDAASKGTPEAKNSSRQVARAEGGRVQQTLGHVAFPDGAEESLPRFRLYLSSDEEDGQDD